MKFLSILILLVSFTVQAERVQIRKSLLEVAELNSVRAKQTAICNSFNSATDKATCNSAVDSIVSARVQTLAGGYINDHIDKASDTLKDQIREEKCVKTYQLRLDDLLVPYTGTETCLELETLYELNKPAPVGSGS